MDQERDQFETKLNLKLLDIFRVGKTTQDMQEMFREWSMFLYDEFTKDHFSQLEKVTYILNGIIKLLERIIFALKKQ